MANNIRKGIRDCSIRPVMPPSRGGWWKDLRRDERWCLAWRTEAMPASAFWYFRSRGAAAQAARAMGFEVSR